MKHNKNKLRMIIAGVFCLFWTLLLLNYSISQTNDSTLSLNLLVAPASPGFVLLGKEPASVERPATVTDFAVNVLTQTNNLSTFPKNYSVEFAPLWLMFGSGITFEEYLNDRPLSNIPQTFSLSIATSSDSSTSLFAGGIRFSVFRGEIDPKFNNYASKLRDLYKELGNLNTRIHEERMNRVSSDSLLIHLQKYLSDSDTATSGMLAPIVEAQLAAREEEINRRVEDSIRSTYRSDLDKINSIIAGMRIRRIGWKLDVAGGVAYDFPGNSFDHGFLTRWGLWTTSGYEGQIFSMLGVFKLLSEARYNDRYSIDIGGRCIYDNATSFSASVEAVYRKYHNDVANDHQWRVALIVDYAISSNNVVSLSYGRDFEGAQTGNIIAALNLIFGFGSTRPIK